MALKDTSTVWDVYLKWHEYNLEKHDKEDFAGIDKNSVNGYDNGRNQTHFASVTASEVDVFKNYELETEDVNIQT